MTVSSRRRQRREASVAAAALAGVVIEPWAPGVPNRDYVITSMPAPYRAPDRVSFRNRWQAAEHALAMLDGKVADDETPKGAAYIGERGARSGRFTSGGLAYQKAVSRVRREYAPKVPVVDYVWLEEAGSIPRFVRQGDVRLASERDADGGAGGSGQHD